MIEKIRVMICDDSSLARRLLITALEADPRLKVVMQARNGQEAVDAVATCKPDIVIMDMVMPVMDGIDAVRAIRRQSVKLPIIMFSSLTVAGADPTIEALAAGASDFVCKPSSTGQLSDALKLLEQQLTPKVFALVAKTAPSIASDLDERQSATPPQKSETLAEPLFHDNSEGIGVVAIGVSTGGPAALATLLRGMQAGFPVPIVITQHMNSGFMGSLVRVLDATSKLTVVEATEGMELQAGKVYIAPGDQHLVFRRKFNRVFAVLDGGPPENSCRPAVDKMFRSVATCFGAKALAVVLTGMGSDGKAGVSAIKATGGRVFAQDESTSVVWGMPGEIVRAGLADRVLPLDQFAMEISRTVAKSHTKTESA